MINNWMELTRGSMGIPEIPAVSLFEHPLTEKWGWVLLAGFFYAQVFGVAHNIKRSALGRILVSINEDEISARVWARMWGWRRLG
ncbi:MAG: hypothetical protein Q8O64_05195 [Sideroxyarcus sp.]|nr:hypothetical protein [Sideroxyarcus sp.]